MGKASTRAQNKYNAKAYDRIEIVVPKGKKAVIRETADSAEESVNGFICKAIDDRLATENYNKLPK